MLNWFKNIKSEIPLKYFPNDPRRSDICIDIKVPLYTSAPRIAVQGWNGKTISEIQKQAAHVFSTLVFGIEMTRKYLKRPFTHWSIVDTLVAIPRAGADANAFYDRSSLKFFFSRQPDGRSVFTSDSCDIVLHELGHAILDSIRPDWWNTQSLEIFAFHEAFSDIISILGTLQHDSVVNQLLKETNNDIACSNFVTRLAEQLGNNMWSLYKKANPEHLRDIWDTPKYKRPEELPSHQREPHAFSQVFSGTFYKALVSVYEEERKAGMEPIQALKNARDLMGKLIFNSIPITATNPRFFASISKSMLLVSNQSFGAKHLPSIRKVFYESGILSDVLFSPMKKTFMMTKDCIVDRLGDKRSIRVKKPNIIESSILKAEVEIPSESSVVIGRYGRIQDELPVEKESSIEAANQAINWLIKNNQIDDEKMFSVVDGKLTRNKSCIF